MDKKDLFEPYNGDKGYIFVSYNHDDSEKVFEIITAFHNRGYRLWHDEGIPVGDNFIKHLAKRVKECKVVFCFLSPAYIESQYCMRELNFALTYNRTFIPIMLEDFELPKETKVVASPFVFKYGQQFQEMLEKRPYLYKLMEMLESSKAPEEKLKELLGHTPLQVISGVVLGALVAVVLS